MGNSDFKNRLLSFYGVKDTDFSDSTPLTGEERIAIVQNNLNVLATVNDLLSLIPCGFLNVPKNINSLDKAMDWFSKLKPSQGKKIGAVVSYFDTDSGVAEVMRFVGGNTLPETIKDSTNWEWFNSGSATFKGLYNNEQELKLSAPSPKVGDHAFVGDNLENSTLYVCSKNGTWRKSKRLFNDIVSKFDAVFSVENGEQLEMYDEFIADKALMDAEGNVISDTYLRIADREILIENIKKQIEDIKKEKFAGINEKNKTFLNLNPDDLAWDMEDRLSFAERPNNTKSKYGFVYLRNEKPLTDDSFSRTGDKIIYAIRFNHDLGGRTINIPDNTVLDFTYGGSFTNGTLNLGKNVIIRTFDRDQIDVKINGQYKLMESVTTITSTPEPTPPPTPKPTPNPDPIVPPTPKPVEPTVVNANVYSSTNNKYTALDTNNLKNSNYTGNIYQGDVMSDGTFKVKKSLVYSTTNEVVYGNQPSYSNGTQFGPKGSTYKYAYNQVNHYWKEGQNTVFTYSTITGRNASADYVEPTAPVTVVRANVYSFSKNSFDEATSAKALERDYKNNLYLGNLMSDGTFQYIKDVVPAVGNANLFGRTESETDVRSLVTTKSAEYKYSYLTRQARWVDGANVIEYHKIVQRKPEYDYVAPITVVRPNVFSFSRDTFDEATSAEALKRNFKNANLFLGNLMSDGSFQYIKFVVQNMDSSYMYGKTENETNVDTLSPNKDVTYRYGYYVEHPKWQDGNNIVEYKKIVRREPQFDYNLRTTRRDVVSYKPNVLEDVTDANLKSKNHTGPIYVGDVYEDNSYSGRAVEHKTEAYVAYSSNANETNFENLSRTGNATNKYAYDVTKHYWEYLGGIERDTRKENKYFVGTRNTQRDFNAGPSIVDDYALSFNRNSYDEVTLAKIKAKGATINHNWIGNSIFIGKLKSDGSYETFLTLPYRNEYLVKYGATENETNIDNLVEYGNAAKPYAYTVVNHIWNGRKPNGDVINYSYLSIGGRKSDSDYSPRKFIKTKNVFSYRQPVYDAVTTDNLKVKNHTGILYFGNEMSDGSMQNGAIQVQEKTTAVILYGNRENLSDNPTFGNKSEVYKYAFNATNHKWSTTALNTDTNLNQTYTVEYNSHLSRNAAKDYGTQPVTPPAPPTSDLSNIVISPVDLSGQILSAGNSNSYTEHPVRFLEDSGIRTTKVRTSAADYGDQTNSIVEGDLEFYFDSNDPLRVYRTKSDGSRALELVGELDYYSVDENSPGKNLNLEYKTVGNNHAFVVNDSRVPELKNLIVFFGESRKKKIGIKDYGANIKSVHQGGKELTTLGSGENGRVFEFDTLLPVTIVTPNGGSNLVITDSANTNRQLDSGIYMEDDRRSSTNKYLIFYKAESLPVVGIMISSQL
jgi:host cell-surface attachment protein PA25957